MCLHPLMPGKAFSQVFRLFSMFSVICGHGSLLLILFPISALRYLMDSPSFRILIDSGMVWFESFEREWDSMTLHLYSMCPAGIIMVLSLLNLAPEARHHLSRSSKRIFVLLHSDRKMAMSSANRDSLAMRSFKGFLILRPWIRFVSHKSFNMGSIARLNSRQDRGSP